MSILFSILAFILFILFVIALIKPSVFTNTDKKTGVVHSYSRKQLLPLFGVFFLVFLILASVTSSKGGSSKLKLKNHTRKIQSNKINSYNSEVSGLIIFDENTNNQLMDCVNSYYNGYNQAINSIYNPNMVHYYLSHSYCNLSIVGNIVTQENNLQKYSNKTPTKIYDTFVALADNLSYLDSTQLVYYTDVVSVKGDNKNQNYINQAQSDYQQIINYEDKINSEIKFLKSNT